MPWGDFADAQGYALRLSQRDSTLAADVTAAKLAINSVYGRVMDGGDNWAFAQATGTQVLVVGQEAYTFTTIGTSLSITCTHVVTLGQTFAGGPELHFLDIDDYNAVKALNPALSNGVPAVWTMTGDSQVLIWPKPNATTALNVVALKQAIELVNDADTPFLPLQFRRELLGKGAAIELMLFEGGAENLAEIARLEAEYAVSMKAMRDSHAIEGPIPRPPPTPVYLPTGLQGTAGSYLDLAQKVCYASRTKPWLAFDLARAKEAVQDCQRMILEDGTRWSFLEATGTQALTSAQQDYAYTAIATSLSVAAVSDVLSLRHSTAGTTLEFMEWDDFQRMTSLNPALSENPPVAWTVYGDSTVRVFPTPTAAPGSVTVLVRKLVATLSADTDQTLIPLEWRDRLIVPYGASRILMERGDEAGAEREMNRFKEAAAAFGKAYGQPELPKEPATVQLPAGLKGTSGTFLDLAQRACYAAGFRPWHAWDVARAKEAVNSTYLRVVGSGDEWDFCEKEGQFTLQANADVYTFASIATAISATTGIAEVLELVSDSPNGSVPLVSVPWVELEWDTASTQDPGESTGEPARWTKWADRLRIWPKPDAAYTLGAFVRLKASEMTADSDTPLIPDDFRRDVIVTGAAAKLLRSPIPGEDNASRAALAEAQDREHEQAVLALRTAHASQKRPTLALMGASYPYSPAASIDAWGDW